MVTYPTDWEITTVEKVSHIGTGCRDTQDNVKGGKYPFYVRSNIVERINVADYDCEAILTAGDGVGTGKVYHYVNGEFAAHQRVYVIKDFFGVDGRFFYYFFSHNFRKEVVKYTAKSSVDSVRRAMIANMEFPKPSLPEQKAIAGTLSCIDAHIANLTELIEKKKAIRNGALDDLVSGRTRLKGFNDEWSETELIKICKVFDGTHQTPKYTNSGIRFVSVENIKNIYFSEKHISKQDYDRDFSVRPEKNDILMTRIGDIGTPCIVTTDEPIAFYVSLALFKSIQINSLFLYYYIMGKSFQKELDDRALHHATPKKINKGEIGKCMVRYPVDEHEQEAIASTLLSLDTEITSLEEEKDKMLQIKAGAMDDLLTGRVRLTKQGG